MSGREMLSVNFFFSSFLVVSYYYPIVFFLSSIYVQRGAGRLALWTVMAVKAYGYWISDNHV